MTKSAQFIDSVIRPARGVGARYRSLSVRLDKEPHPGCQSDSASSPAFPHTYYASSFIEALRKLPVSFAPKLLLPLLRYSSRIGPSCREVVREAIVVPFPRRSSRGSIDNARNDLAICRSESTVEYTKNSRSSKIARHRAELLVSNKTGARIIPDRSSSPSPPSPRGDRLLNSLRHALLISDRADDARDWKPNDLARGRHKSSGIGASRRTPLVR